MAKRKRDGDEDSGEITRKLSATSKRINPTLSALFSSSINDASGAEGASSKALERLPKDDLLQSSGHIDEADVAKSLPEHLGLGGAAAPTLVTIEAEQRTELKRQPSKAQKHRSKTNGHDIEDIYLQRLAREEAREAANISQGDESLNAKLDKTHDHDARDKEPGLDSDDEFGRDDSDTGFIAPQHEALTTTVTTEVERANRTVFLGNVSTTAIKSKTSKKELLDHLASFIPSLPASATPHRIESIRFRSTAFSSTAVPRKASFAKKELMEATTQSTNAYVIYSTPPAAREAIKRLSGTTILGRHLRVDSVAHPAKADHRRCIFVGNLGFVDDESMIREAQEDGKKHRRKKQQPGDVEEGLWQQFSNAGKVENVRVVRDSTTRVGKGFAYVQFYDANAVERALLFNDQKFPPMLARQLRVTRAKKVTKTALHSSSLRATRGSEGVLGQKDDVRSQSLAGRAPKLLGKAGVAQLRKPEGSHARTGRSNIPIRAPEKFIFEGYRAKSGQSFTALRSGGSGKKAGKPRTRSSRRGAAFKAKSGKRR